MNGSRQVSSSPCSTRSATLKVGPPTLIIHSDGCALPDQARKVYGLLAGPKILHWAEGKQFDFYDQPDTVRLAADRLAAHFRDKLV